MKKCIFLLVALCLLNACHYVEIDYENTKDSNADIDYTNPDDLYQPVIGAYSKLRWPGMHWASNMLWTGRDDDMTSGRTDDQGEALKFGYRGGYLCPNDFWRLESDFTDKYEIITSCNAALDALNQYAQYINRDTNASAYADYLSYCGEVKTIRAWAYYMLVTTFGPCVILRDNSQSRMVRSKPENVCKYVIEDLEGVIPNMQRLRPNQMKHKGACTAFTAAAMAARFALLIGDYAKVETLTDDIINNGNFALYTDYYNLFKPLGKQCDESLLEVQVKDDGTQQDAIGIDQWYNYMGASLVGPDGKTMGGWTFMRYNPAFLAWAKERGDSLRIITSCLQGGTTTPEGWKVNADSSVIFNGKAYIPYDQMYPNATNWERHNNSVRLLRYAEVLLMNAEAKVRLGKNGDAPLNEVRTRAGLTPISGATIEDILDERRMELCGEWGLRYTDLVRTGLAATVLNNPDLVRDFASGDWTPEKTYWPLPGKLLSSIPDLEIEPE